MKHALSLALVTVILAPIVVLSQSTYVGVAKLDVGLKRLLADRKISTSKISDMATPQGAPEMLPIIFKCDPTEAEAIVVRYGGVLHTRIKNIFTALVPLTTLMEFASERAVTRVESSVPVRMTNDVARRQVGVDLVQEGSLPSDKSYTGKGVLVGVVDSGIDFANADFRKRTDTTLTRIVYIWDQKSTAGKPPTNPNYGSEWNNAELNAALGNPATIYQDDLDGHGTHVAGTAAGLRGMAPDAQIIIVKPDTDYETYTLSQAESKGVLDAIAYIYNKAVLLDMPCVVNLSWGYTTGAAHDGSSLVEQAMDAFVEQRRGFIISVAAGNDNGTLQHYGGYALGRDSTWTYARDMQLSRLFAAFKSENDDSTFISVLVDSAEYDADFEVLTGFKNVYQTPWISVASIKNSPTALDFTAFFGNGDSAAVIQLVGARVDDQRTEVVITTNPKPERAKGVANFATARLFKIATKGKGVFHSWWQTSDGVGGSESPISYGCPTNSAYRLPDDQYVVNIMACGHNTLAVGAYIGREYFVNALGFQEFGANNRRDTAGSIARFSSLGPTADGRIKPDISAPGVNVLSTRARSVTWDPPFTADKNTVGLSGTSMSCPVTSGAIALYLEQNPLADFAQVKTAITTTAITDKYTQRSGALPNNMWGFGKLDIFAAMGGIRIVGVTDEAPTEHTGAGNATPSSLRVFPNPATDVVQFNAGEDLTGKTLIIYDVKGSVVAQLTLASNAQMVNVETWNKGAYYYRVGASGATGWFVVE